VRALFAVVGLIVFVSFGAAVAADPVEVQATVETEPFFDADDADADDPAIWVHPSEGAKSIVVGALKNGGLAVFDLHARTIQRIDYADKDARQNNVDLLYGVELGGTRRDLAVVTDRGLDHLRVFAIDQAGSSASSPLTEVTEPDPPVIFEGDNDISAYGIAAWKGADEAGYVAVSQRHRTTLVLLRLIPAPGGTVGFDRLDRLVLPSTFTVRRGETWSPCAEEEGELPQVEGMVADARRGLLFAAQEDVGVWRIAIQGNGFGHPKLFDRVREFGQSYTRTPGEEEGEFECDVDETSPSAGNPDLVADSEGLTIYRYGRERGYLLASSQGSSSFVVYDLSSLTQLRTFAIGAGTTDAVDDSDGAMVVGLPLGPTFAGGLLVTHDGDDEPFDDATNFKFTRWVDVARPLGLEVDTVSGDPRE
jgi:3-phytase